MFFKKKVATPTSFVDMGKLFIDIATQLYSSLGDVGGKSSLSAVLEFDDQQRVISVKDLFVDGVLRMPPADTIAAMNVLAQPMVSAPADQKLRSLKISILDGRISTDVRYLVS